MSDDELESIREKKRDELLGRETEADGDGADDGNTKSAVGPGEPIHVESVEHFSEVTTDYGVTLVDFHADWCGPCTMLEPVVDAVARKTDAAVAKVDVDDHQGLASQYGVRGVPTLLLFADGEQVEQLVGVQDEGHLTKLVERHA
ncbi:MULTISPECIES: thioredoxin [Halorussus]|uniref:thioredoxin n=1 Tax=Halorussus TaxID=1070314 RepID=UPI00209F232F|nr:thioredoxin [Halorussus vallis]USZ77851.1 thioredoxin [Halorussus vallis]